MNAARDQRTVTTRPATSGRAAARASGLLTFADGRGSTGQRKGRGPAIFGRTKRGTVMAVESELRAMRVAAEQAAWQVDPSDLIGVGHDESHAVRVEVDHSDRVTKLEIAPRWSSMVGDGLAPAVLTAIQAAVEDRRAAWVRRVEERADTPAPNPASGPASTFSGGQLLPTGSGRATATASGLGPQRFEFAPAPDAAGQLEVMQQLVQQLRQTRDELRRYQENLRDQQQQEIVGRSGDHVTVRLTGGQITDVEFSQRWLRQQPGSQVIATETLHACRAAYQAAAERTAEMMAAFPAITALQPSGDPTALLRRLGLLT